MSGTSDYLENKLVDMRRGQAFSWPATTYFGFIVATKGNRANSTAYALNDTIVLTANDSKPHLYKCTTAGTTAAAQGTLYPGVVAEAITDGTAAFTEQSAVLDANTTGIINEPAIGTGAYARVALAASLANWSGTQAAGSTVASSGAGGTTSNNVAITFASPTSNWASGSAMAVGIVEYDAASAGNLLTWGMMGVAKTINSGDAAPAISVAGLSYQYDN